VHRRSRGCALKQKLVVGETEKMSARYDDVIEKRYLKRFEEPRDKPRGFYVACGGFGNSRGMGVSDDYGARVISECDMCEFPGVYIHG